MLQIDSAHAASWVEQMQKLVDEELPDEEFTAKRMMLLKEWEKSRHREQKSLHYRYDPLKRSRRLVDRDVEKALAKARAVIAEHRAKLEARQVGIDATIRAGAQRAAQRTSQSARPMSAPRARIIAPVEPVIHPGLAELDEHTRTMYENLSPDVDIATAPDEDLRRIWAERWPGMSAELIDSTIAEINGR